MAGEDHTLDPDATLVPGEGGAYDPQTDALLVGRYTLGELIGRGGSGQVHRALDTLTGQSVAVKFVRAMSVSDQRQLRRELTALRLLDLPGVVRLLDDGESRGQVFLVMELLEGGPLSALSGPYARWGPAARQLVETLARVHFAGVIHRDLKPGNILLDAQGSPRITDFGLAQGRAVEAADGSREGTPRYMSPEQWAGDPCDERSDLYALGAILWELLLDRRFEGTADRERALRAEGPLVLRQMVVRLLDPDPGGRPTSAAELLEALGGGDAVLGPLPALPDRVDRPWLEALVDEAQPSFQHLAADFASLLLDHTDGSPERVRQTLASWIRAGRCHWSDGRIRVDRAALSALRWDADALVGLSRSQGGDEVAEAALGIAELAWQSGHPGRSMAVLEGVLPLCESADAAQRVRVHLTARALFLNDQGAIRRALYRAERAADAPVSALLHGVRLCVNQEMRRATELLDRIDRLPEALEIWRVAWLLHALGRLDPLARDALLARMEPWCRADPVRLARWLGWRGRVHYVAGHYALALADHDASASLLGAHPVERLTALVNAATAALEAVSLDRAVALAREAGALGRDLRHPVAECYASVVLRSAQYRSGSAGAARPDLVAAAAAVSTVQEAQHALIEAAIAWRAGEPAGLPLAVRAEALYTTLTHRGRCLALALVQALGGEGKSEQIAELALACGDPTLALQAVALGAQTSAPTLPVAAWAGAWHLADPAARADVLSLDECLERLRAGSPPRSSSPSR